MIGKSILVNGIVVQSKPFFEKDKRISLFTLEKGLITILAKRAYAKNVRLGGSLDVLNSVTMHLNKGKSFYYCVSADLHQSTPYIRKNFDALSTALYFCELIKKAVCLEIENKPLFYLLKQGLLALEAGKDISDVKKKFQIFFLKVEGIYNSQMRPTDDAFQVAYETYTGKKLTMPRLIGRQGATSCLK